MRAVVGALVLFVGVAAVLASDDVIVATSRHVRRPTSGYVRAEMVAELPASTQSSAATESDADSRMTNSVASAQLHPMRTATTMFSSAPKLSAAEQAEADARGVASDEFTPEPLANAAPVPTSAPAELADAVDASAPTDAYIEVADELNFWTEDERAGREEVSLAEVRARVSVGPRKYLAYFGHGNTGTMLARYEHQTASSCQERCESDSSCVGYSIAVSEVEKGLCTLRSSWGNSVENQNFDSYQGHDFSLTNLPFKDLVAFPKTTVEGQTLFVIADIARIRPESKQKSTELIASVDGNLPASLWTNVARNYDDEFRAVSFAGVTAPLKNTGEHTVRVQYSQAFATPKQADSTDGKGCMQQRLTAIPFPTRIDAAGMRGEYDVVGQHWNLAATASLSSKQYAAIPGAGADGESARMAIKVAVPADGSRLFIVGDISRVQHSNGWTNSAFRILVDGQEIAYTNTGEHYAYQYRAVSLRAGSKALKKGMHTVEVQGRTQQGRVFFLSDGHGFQQRRLSAIVVPKGMSWQRSWNLGTSWLKAPEWHDLPGAEMAMTFTTKLPGFVFVDAGISRIQAWGNANVELRIVVTSEVEDEDGKSKDAADAAPRVLAVHNTGVVNGWRYHDVAFHGASADVLPPGKHTVRVQFKSAKDNTVVFYNDANGYQQRRLNAILFSASSGFQHVVHDGVCGAKKAAAAPAPAAPAAPAAAKL